MSDTNQHEAPSGMGISTRCPAPMRNGVCGRSSLGPLIDGIPYCLMHIPLEKDNNAFQVEFERIPNEAQAGNHDADFTGFVFPQAWYQRREFKVRCLFSEATFTRPADFSMSTFKQGADFNHAKLIRRADFHSAGFEGVTWFNGAVFSGRILFDSAAFKEPVMFTGASFAEKAQFITSVFSKEADFTGTTFTLGVDFDNANFDGEAYFDWATFTKAGNFSHATFKDKVSFCEATFVEGAGFWKAKFEKYVDFTAATFKEAAFFPSTAFGELVDFARARFLGSVEFAETRFRQDESRLPGPAFYMTEFSKPEAVLFRKTYLGQALFHNCNISKVNFSSVAWRERPGNGKRMAFEEEVDLNDKTAVALKLKEGEPNERDYSLITVLYQQLKKNYDDHMDYSVGDEFHYGEMEMKRLYSQSRNVLVRWLRRNLGLVALYKYASEYGNSYVRPVLMLGVVFAVFTLLFPLAGLERSENSKQLISSGVAVVVNASAVGPDLSYRHFGDFAKGHQERKWLSVARFFGNSLMTTLSVAGFQKELKYEPSYPWGRALALIEVLFTSALVALFLLAVRRQFRR